MCHMKKNRNYITLSMMNPKKTKRKITYAKNVVAFLDGLMTNSKPQKFDGLKLKEEYEQKT